jgi:Arc/MetJ-type ribon-helix-helix transcriptional regulator
MSYTTIKLPSEFVEQVIDPLVSDAAQGFSSRADVVKAALREFAKDNTPNEKKIGDDA